MNRLQTEFQRLYLPQAGEGEDDDPERPRLIDGQGRVRALVLELARPADWAALSKVWQGVQADLGLPAPAIAVSGKDGYQLWFSLADPLPAPSATAFLEGLRLRYLGEIKTQRVGLMPALDASSPPQALHARAVPQLQGDSGHWSAFVAPDLAPVFAEEPWLDLPPNFDGQASLLSHLESIQPDDFRHALERLERVVTPAHPQPASGTAGAARAGTDRMIDASAPAGAGLAPKRFLLDVMNDHTVALALRIEAAKALLPYCEDVRRS